MEEYIVTTILSAFVGLLLYVLKERGKTIKENAKHILEIQLRLDRVERCINDKLKAP